MVSKKIKSQNVKGSYAAMSSSINDDDSDKDFMIMPNTADFKYGKAPIGSHKSASYNPVSHNSGFDEDQDDDFLFEAWLRQRNQSIGKKIPQNENNF
jgi:hypothetical protein